MVGNIRAIVILKMLKYNFNQDMEFRISEDLLYLIPIPHTYALIISLPKYPENWNICSNVEIQNSG